MKTVNANDKSYTRVAYNCKMNRNLVCTALSPAAIAGIEELGLNAKLLCNKCNEQMERDNCIRCRTLAKVAEKFDRFYVGKNGRKWKGG